MTPETQQKERADWQLHDEWGRRKYVDVREFRRFLGAAKLLPEAACMFCELVAYAGCRISEALNLCGHHLSEGEVVFRTLKRRKRVFRTVPLPEWLTARLICLLAGDPAARLWNVSRNTAYGWIIRCMQFAGIDGIHACPKGLRHCFGVRNAFAKTPLSLIKKWMGHANIKTTLIYLDLVGPDEREFAERTW